MAKDWIERKTTDFAGQAQIFAGKIAVDYAAYEISAEDAALLSADYAIFADAYRAAQEPSSRTSGTVMVQTQARKQLTDRMRQIAGRVRSNPTITDVMKIDLTMTVPGAAPIAPAGPPDSRPTVRILSAANNLITVRLTTEGLPTTRRRPRGVSGAQLFYRTGPQASPDVNDWRAGGVTHSSKATIALPFFPPGTKVWVCARWFNGRGQSGALSLPASTYLGDMVISTSMAA